MFGGLIVLNQGRSCDDSEPGLNKTLAKVYVKETPKHGPKKNLTRDLFEGNSQTLFFNPNFVGLFFFKKE